MHVPNCRREHVAATGCRHRGKGTQRVPSPIYLDVKVTGGWIIHHVQLACPPGSEDTLRGFYTGVLGFQELAKPPMLAARGGCWFGGHGIELHLGAEN